MEIEPGTSFSIVKVDTGTLTFKGISRAVLKSAIQTLGSYRIRKIASKMNLPILAFI